MKTTLSPAFLARQKSGDVGVCQQTLILSKKALCLYTNFIFKSGGRKAGERKFPKKTEEQKRGFKAADAYPNKTLIGGRPVQLQKERRAKSEGLGEARCSQQALSASPSS